MAEKVLLQESKEFQLRINIDATLAKGRRVRGRDDEALFRAAAKAIREAVDSLARESEVDIGDDRWQRDGIRYDAADGRLKAHQLTLAIEATDKRTKLKFKQHDFISELLFAKPDQATVYPDIRKSGGYGKHDTTLKREQDIHLDNTKFCASGSLYVKGRQTDAKDSSFFSRYFPGLEAVLPKATPLQAVSHWDETVFDDMRTGWKRTDIDNWMLVNRWDAKTKTLLESELSFKIVKKMDAAWDYPLLKDAGALYLALRNTGLFVELPPIFSFANPVSSFAIVKAPGQA